MSMLVNPFRPGAGHPPPYLAGRTTETEAFGRLLRQEVIVDNLILAGLRGVGKTVLLDTVFKPLAVEAGWLTVGTDFNEAVSEREENLIIRMLADLATVSSSIGLPTDQTRPMGFGGTEPQHERLDYAHLSAVYTQTPGLPVDKLKTVLERAWGALRANPGIRGIVFTYDEAHNLVDRPAAEQHALALLLDAFHSLQRQGLPVMLALAGLPTLFAQLVQSRTFAQRMFEIIQLGSLTPAASREAIVRPVQSADAIRLSEGSTKTIVELSGGYPYFIQFICREVYDAFIQRADRGEAARVPVAEIMRKLDIGFFAGPWAGITDRQRQLLYVIAKLGKPGEFTLQEVLELSHGLLERPFGASAANQMLAALGKGGLVFKNRHGRYSFAVPLLGSFILRECGDTPP